MERRYANAADCVPEPCVIANTVMRPFSLGHHLLMKRLSLPFSGSPLADAGPDDFALGIAICAGAYDQTLSDLLSGAWGGKVARWRRRAAGPWWNRRRVNWKESEQLFRAYLAVGYEHPPVMRRMAGSDSLSLTAPWEELLLCCLTQAGFSAAEVLNGYLPAMWYHYYTVMEIHKADTCKDAKTWKRIFVTQEIAEALNNG